jgi:hypothetical protein
MVAVDVKVPLMVALEIVGVLRTGEVNVFTPVIV